MKRQVLVTGAAGEIGIVLRKAIAHDYRLVASDVRPTPLMRDETWAPADLCVPAEVEAAARGVDAIVHLGGIANEHTWERIAAVNIGGTQAVLEAARKAGVKRVVLASSVHAVGFWPRATLIGTDVEPRPDTFYGVSKVAGEALGRLYGDKWGLEVACLRIASFQAEPRDRRHLSTWLSHGDMTRLVCACLEAPTLSSATGGSAPGLRSASPRFVIVNAISRNTRRWMRDDHWDHLGYRPEDDAERFAAAVEHIHGPEGDVTELVQGGFFAAADYRGLAG